MEATITCPVCGETNPADMVICQNCQWPLRPSTPSSSTGGAGAADASPNTNGSPPEPVLPDWLRDAATDFSKALEKPDAGRRRPAQGLLSGLAPESPDGTEKTPDWVMRIGGTSGAERTADATAGPLLPGQDAGGSAPSGHAVVPGRKPATPPMPAHQRGIRPAIAGDEPSEAKSDATAGQEASAAPENDIYEWLRRLDATAAQTAQPRAEEMPALNSRLPEWATGQDQEPEPPPGPRGQQDETHAPAAPAAAEEPLPNKPDVDSGSTTLGEPAAAEAAPVPQGQSEVSAQAQRPSPTSEGVASLDVDAVLASMQTPDWLWRDSVADAMSAADLPPAAEEGDAISPAELPSWVEALRPIESAVPETAAVTPADVPVERGPLLGLQGVLPSIPGVGRPTRPPAAHGLHLEITDEQRLRAAQLEGIIAREAQPIPLQAMQILSPQRLLRWGIAASLLLVIGWALLSGSQAFPLPSGVPNETLSAVRAVEAIPADARVLLVFDYEPATVGEMEASGASLLDHLLLLRHPVLALVSTSPTGSVLAERFLSTALADRDYQPGSGYINLGYLPGGLAGVRAFAEDPTSTMPLDAASVPSWGTPALTNVHRLSDFAAILVLTDTLESGRVWIEQTTEARGTTPMIVVSSAQAGPLLLPYAASGQIAGLVAGLNGAAGAEMANSGLPGYVRRYWDSYSLGLYAAALLIVLGSSWRFIGEILERRTGFTE